jgi:hypothetical protein
MLNKVSNKLDDPISRRLRLFHGQHTVHTANKLVVEGLLLVLCETRQLHGAQRVDQLAVCRCRLLRLVEDCLDRFRGVGEHDARHFEWRVMGKGGWRVCLLTRWWWAGLQLWRLEGGADRRTEGCRDAGRWAIAGAAAGIRRNSLQYNNPLQRPTHKNAPSIDKYGKAILPR